MKEERSQENPQGYKTAPGPTEPQNFWENPFGIFTALSRQYGDIVCLDPENHRIYLVNHPTPIKHILQDNYRNYRKDSDTFKPILGEGLLVSEGDFWLRQRRIVQPAFHRRGLETMLEPMITTTEKMIKDWRHNFLEQDQSFDIFTEMTKLAINMSASTMFGADIKDETEALSGAITAAQEYIYYQGWNYEETEENQAAPEITPLDNAINTIDRIVYRIINERRGNEQGKNDLLTMLLHASDEKTGSGMTEKQLRDEVVTLLAAGQGTTAIALTWAWYLLANRPDVMQRIRAEVAQEFGQNPITFENLSNLPYTRMVVNEVLRLYPPSWLTARRSLADDEVGGYHIPENSEIFISIPLIHRHPAFWKNPEMFDPEHFSPEQSAERPHFAYLPFGSGPHICIGNQFALIAIQLVLALISQTYDLHLTTQQEIQPQPQILLQPSENILIKLGEYHQSK